MKTLSLLALLLPSLAASQVSDALASHWTYDKNAPLNLHQISEQARDGVRIVDITYSSPVADRGQAVGPNGGVVAAYLVRPSGTGRFPAVIYGHWCMPGSEKKSRTEFLEEAIVLARSGVISLLPDHVTVRPGFVENETPMNDAQIEVAVQQVVNLRRGLDLLVSRPDVDPGRLAYVGHSCDAASGGFLSGLERRFKALVLMAGALSDEADSKTKAFQDYRQEVGAERFDAFLAKYSWTDVGKYTSKAAPQFLFLQFAGDEPYMTADLEMEYVAIASEPKKYKIYQAQHALNAEATRDRIAFLSEQLSFKKPDARAVDAIPALVQPPWPKAN